MIKIGKNKNGCIFIYFDDAYAEVLEIEVQDNQYVAKRGEKMAVKSLSEEPLHLRSISSNESYIVKMEQKAIHVFNNDGVDLYIR